MSAMILIDSFGWVEYFANGLSADKYAEYVKSANQKNAIAPTIVVYKVYRRIKHDKGE
jgi:hypothetical protein